MALRPGEQDGKRLAGAGSIVVPAGCVVNYVQCDPLTTGAGATVDVSAFEPSIGGTIPVPADTTFHEEPKDYEGDGTKAITFGGDVSAARVAWKVL